MFHHKLVESKIHKFLPYQVQEKSQIQGKSKSKVIQEEIYRL